MGAGSSQAGKYVVGVLEEKKEKSPETLAIDEKFALLVKDVKNRIESANTIGAKILSTIRPSSDAKYAKYVDNYRKSMSEKYSEIEENNMSKDLPDRYLRDKSILLISYYSQKVRDIDTSIASDCDIKGFCPRHVIDPNTGKERKLESLDDIHPCQLRSCMKEQLESQLEKYKRWLVTMKWAGDTAASSDKIEDREINREGLLDILHRVQQTVLAGIESVSSVKSEDTEKQEDSIKPRFSLFDFLELISQRGRTNYTLLITVVVVIIIIAVIVYSIVRTPTFRIPAAKIQ